MRVLFSRGYEVKKIQNVLKDSLSDATSTFNLIFICACLVHERLITNQERQLVSFGESVKVVAFPGCRLEMSDSISINQTV